ncbi:MAG: hypothetical protein EOO27_23465, partial [Comamonadaceae bacterium]
MSLKRTAPVMQGRLRWALLAPVMAAILVACGGGGGGGFAGLPVPPITPPESTCPETGPYACKSGETEPLYTFQWALNYARSWFTDNADAGAYGSGFDLNVEPVHRLGIKGQGVNVLVIDSGVDLAHEDLRDNADYSLSWNYLTNNEDPSPLLTASKAAHGTNVAGIIGAAQNGKGVMGIAPRVRLGGTPLILSAASDRAVMTDENFVDAYGGAAWSRRAHVINASYGGDTGWAPYAFSGGLIGLRSLKASRDGKGVVFVKSAGNSFDATGAQNELNCGPLRGMYDCTNPANDIETLEPNVIATAALNAKGQASSYSSAGSVVWITGMGGEYGGGGRYGERSGLTAGQIASGRTADGPTIFSTDIRSCTEGYSRKDDARGTEFQRGESELVAGTRDNPNCDYGYMNGTSSAAPTISAVTALMLSANPDLSWRDVRDILRLSARAVDPGYEKRVRNDLRTVQQQPYNALFDLRTNQFAVQGGDKNDIQVGANRIPIELGWQKNAAGNVHSNWYGFGVPDAEKAVALAQLYKKEPARSKPARQQVPAFVQVAEGSGFDYQKVALLAEFAGADQVVDQFQIRLNANDICLGSLGVAVESPSGTKSLLKMPLDHFVLSGDSDFESYGLGIEQGVRSQRVDLPRALGVLAIEGVAAQAVALEVRIAG